MFENRSENKRNGELRKELPEYRKYKANGVVSLNQQSLQIKKYKMEKNRQERSQQDARHRAVSFLLAT
jgi:hypothetical protein